MLRAGLGARTLATAARPHRLRMLLMGCPGSGKGTLSARIEQKYGVPIITAGDLLRWHTTHGTELGREAAEVIRAGKLMPDKTMMALVGQKLDEMGDADWILDGFPRTSGQASLLNDMLHREHRPLSLVVNLCVPEEVILQRVLDRWTHIPNLSYNPPKTPGVDDITGEPLEKRDDDNPETFRKRIESFHAKTEPMINYFRTVRAPSDPSQPLLVDLAGRTSNEIWPKLQHTIESRFDYLRTSS
ncbi:hypothetical protein CBS9595_002985 [Malassezia furfur]|nr:hypothetical protein CBS9595_002985 [Malassezia furfur]